MNNLIKKAIKEYVVESKDNYLKDTKGPYYDEPMIQFASADDLLFEEYKKIIGQDHLTPREAFELTFGSGSYVGGTVISVLLPINEKIRKTNAAQKEQASKEWALLRTFGDEMFLGLRTYIKKFINELGYRTVAPLLETWYKINVTESGPCSNWSERHIAYAAGLGTFGINDGFITEKGIAIRLVSVITELKLIPDVRVATTHTENCLFYSKNKCGSCIKRCPVGAISSKGHDKVKCLQYVYGKESQKLAESYGGIAKLGSGCGLCQTNVPCESKNPVNK